MMQRREQLRRKVARMTTQKLIIGRSGYQSPANMLMPMYDRTITLVVIKVFVLRFCRHLWALRASM